MQKRVPVESDDGRLGLPTDKFICKYITLFLQIKIRQSFQGVFGSPIPKLPDSFEVGLNQQVMDYYNHLTDKSIIPPVDYPIEADGTLFSPKETYVMSHTDSGKATFLEKASTRISMYRYDNMHLAGSLKITEHSGICIPQMDAYTGTTDFTAYPFSKRKGLSGHNQAIHFFQNDNEFRSAVWNRLEQTSFSLSKFDVLFTPDFTMFIEDYLSFNALQAVYMTRFVGAYWQQVCGYQVIPTLSFGNADSLKYTMWGLPSNSVLGVCGVGVSHSPKARNLWCYALREAERLLSPTLFIVYGPDFTVPGLKTPVKFIPDYISTHFRHGKDKNQ